MYHSLMMVEGKYFRFVLNVCELGNRASEQLQVEPRHDVIEKQTLAHQSTTTTRTRFETSSRKHRKQKILFSPQPCFVHITGILRSYLLVVGISHIWHKEMVTDTCLCTCTRFMYLFGIGVFWYTQLPHFSPECIPELHMNTLMYTICCDLFLVLMGSFGRSKHSLLGVM